MKILFASDVHGSKNAMYRLLDIVAEEQPDRKILLGDFCGGDVETMRACFTALGEYDYTEGNCDRGRTELYGISAPSRFAVASVAGRQLFACHGHEYGAYNLPPFLGEGDIFVYGHLHFPSITTVKGIIVVNVGSLAAPRYGAEKTYAIIDDSGVYIKTAEGKEVFRREF